MNLDKLVKICEISSDIEFILTCYIDIKCHAPIKGILYTN